MALRLTVPRSLPDVQVSVDRRTEHAMREQEESERQRIHPAAGLLSRHEALAEDRPERFRRQRQIRFGHLTGTEEWQIVIPQAQKRVDRDSYGHISCLTAIDLFGNVLWQRGEPSENAPVLGKISADLPCQVYDIDGDGYDEVITAKNFEILILDGRTGEIKKSAPTPFSDEPDESLIGVPLRGVRL